MITILFLFPIKGAWSIPVDVLVGPSDGVSYRPEQGSKVRYLINRKFFYEL